MSSEILSVLEYMEKEKGIPRADMIATIVNALKTAALKGINSGQELKIDINPKNGQLHAWAVMKVVDSIGNVCDDDRDVDNLDLGVRPIGRRAQ
jgi:N utilization substance protein A